jgi:hypothetical protein
VLPAAGDPTVSGPPFPLTPLICYLVLSAGVGTPRDFMAPTRTTNPSLCGEALKPDVGLAT